MGFYTYFLFAAGCDNLRIVTRSRGDLAVGPCRVSANCHAGHVLWQRNPCVHQPRPGPDMEQEDLLADEGPGPSEQRRLSGRDHRNRGR